VLRVIKSNTFRPEQFVLNLQDKNQSTTGRKLYRIIGDYDLTLLNGKTPTFLRPSSTTTSILDLALASPHLAQNKCRI